MLPLKRIGCWPWLIPVLGIPLSYYWSPGSAPAGAWLVVVLVFGVVPLPGLVIGASRPIRTRPSRCRD